MFTLNCKGRLLTVDKPIIMGILNITPDSFYSGSRHSTVESVLKKAGQMLDEGATVLDIGGQSTRPGSERISEDEELKRVIPAIESVCRAFPEAFVSVDTFYSRVAEEAVNAGASIVNDISGGSIDQEMIPAVSRLHVPYVLMHMQGTPGNMQQKPSYTDVVTEVLDYFIRKISELNDAGVHDIIIDPGFGFGKSAINNFELLSNLEIFCITAKPVLVGISRKSMVYKTLGKDIADSLNGTTVLHTIALMNGAKLLRVHDVTEAMEAVTLHLACKSAGK
jgi:dihydropteroate synthase